MRDILLTLTAAACYNIRKAPKGWGRGIGDMYDG